MTFRLKANPLCVYSMGGYTRSLFSRGKSIYVINGPNLNLLGAREPHLYGDKSLFDINCALIRFGAELGYRVVCYQSNHEGELIDCIHKAQRKGVKGIVFNPAAYTHTSVALRDALLGVRIPFVEVHLTDPASREEFRKHSYFADIAVSVVSGAGPKGYEVALDRLVREYLEV